ncbi:MAG: L-proline glycine betaine ABC transport system permease protein ProW, partial [uncultured Solirubrobacteraceae bacterium]
GGRQRPDRCAQPAGRLRALARQAGARGRPRPAPGDRLRAVARPASVAGDAQLAGAARTAQRAPGLAARPALGSRSEHRLRHLRRLPRDRRLAGRRSERPAAGAHLARNGDCRRAARPALRRLARGGDRRPGVRLPRAHGALGGEHPDARPDAGRGDPVAGAGSSARHRGRALGPLPPRDLAGAGRHADRAGVRLPDAGGDPLLRRPGGRGDRDDDLRGAAGGAHHRAGHPRGDSGHGRGVPGDGRHARADAGQGPAAAGAPTAAAGGQPDDHVRALAGGDRRPDRRARPRRCGHERAVLERRPGAAGGDRDRDHGDRPRPRNGGHRRAHRPDAAPPHRRCACEGPPRDDRHLRRDRRGGRHRALPGPHRGLPRRVRDRDLHLPDHHPRRAAGRDPVGARLRAGSGVAGLRHHGADRQLPRALRPRAAARGARRGAVVGDAGQPVGHGPRGQRHARGGGDLPDALRHRRHGCLGRGDGHRLPGAGRHGDSGRARHRLRDLGRREPARGPGDATGARHAADAAAARLHHPLHLPHAGLARPRRGRLGALRRAGDHPAGRLRPARGAARRRRVLRGVRRHQSPDPHQGQAAAGARRDHAGRQPGDHHGARRGRHRRPGRLRRARRRGRPRTAAQRVRRRRGGLAGHPRARHRARPRDPGAAHLTRPAAEPAPRPRRKTSGSI